MENKKRNTIITVVILVLIFLGGAIYFFLNYTPDENSFSVVEKKWITDNLNNIVDVNVYNDIPVYGYNGEGIIFGFLDYFTKETDINFNKISYYTNSELTERDISFQILNSNEVLSNQDILMYQDHYVILGLDTTSTVSLDDKFNLGVLSNDLNTIIHYKFSLKYYTQQHP